MGIESAKGSQGYSEVPAGVPGERDTTFSNLDELLHANLKAKYGTDDPEQLERVTSGRKEMVQQFGPPAEVIGRDQYSEFKNLRASTDRIRLIEQVTALQREWNALVGERADLAIRIAGLETELLEIGEVESPLLHPFKARRRAGVLERLHRLNGISASKKHKLSELASFLAKNGFNPIREEELYKENI